MIRKIIGYGLFLVYVVASVYVRFSNPDMTETQLIIAFWPLWVSILPIVLAEMWLFKDSAKKQVPPTQNPFFSFPDDKAKP